MDILPFIGILKAEAVGIWAENSLSVALVWFWIWREGLNLESSVLCCKIMMYAKEASGIVWKTNHVALKKKKKRYGRVSSFAVASSSRLRSANHSPHSELPYGFNGFVRRALTMWMIHCCAEQNGDSFLLKSRADESHKETEGFIYSQDLIVPVN